MRVVRTVAPVRRQVLENVRRAIAEQRFRPGDRLIERELCALMGVSRTSVREALRQLEAEGLVINEPDRGPVVASITPEQAEGIYQVRALLEGLAGRLFAERATDAEVAALRRAVEAVAAAQRAGDVRAFLAAKDEFYDLLLRGCRNETAHALLKSIQWRVTVLRATSLAQPGRGVESVREVRRIVEAIERRDPDAAERLSIEHARRAGEVAIRALREQLAAAAGDGSGAGTRRRARAGATAR